jgi:hypothetical protein
MISLPTIRTQIVGAHAIITDPTVNKTSAVMITGLLPNLSERYPPISAPRAAPTSAIETMFAI